MTIDKTVSDYFLRMRHVVGVGMGRKTVNRRPSGQDVLVVMVDEKVPFSVLATADRVPRFFDTSSGRIMTDVLETGRFRALRTGRFRPAPGGVSIGHIDITAGTLGCIMRRGDDLFIVSNNHVLANSNLGKVGDAIIQPGRHDNGTPDDRIATLAEFVTIHFDEGNGNGGDPPPFPPPDCPWPGRAARLDPFNWLAWAKRSHWRLKPHRIRAAEPNYVDAAIARPVDEKDVMDEILEIGVPAGVRTDKMVVGDPVVKSGRTTGKTSSTVQLVEATVQVSGYPGGKATFYDQVITNAGFSSGGDSGSIVLSPAKEIVGLLFAGTQDGTTVFNRIVYVMDLLRLEW